MCSGTVLFVREGGIVAEHKSSPEEVLVQPVQRSDQGEVGEKKVNIDINAFEYDLNIWMIYLTKGSFRLFRT